MRESNIGGNFEKYRRSGVNNPLFDLLTNEFDDFMLEKGLSDDFILSNLFVDNRAEGDSDSSRIYNLWERRTKGISRHEDLKSNIALNDDRLVYLLLGKKGTGKTITLKHFARKIQKDAGYPDDLHIIYLNLMTKKHENFFLKSLEYQDHVDSLMEKVYDTILNDKSKKDITNGSLLSYLTDVDKARLLNEKYRYYQNDKDVMDDIDNKRIDTIKNLFRHLSFNEHKTYLIIDNIDDFPITSIKNIIDRCIELTQDYNLKCIVALRSYWNPQNLKIDDKNIASYYLNNPNIYDIVMKRLELIPIDRITSVYTITYGTHSISIDAEETKNTFKAIVDNIIKSSDIHNKMYEFANHDVREHLFNIYNFLHSPYLYSKPVFTKAMIEKIREIDESVSFERIRPPQFFDFIECAMAIHALCYDTAASKIINIFFHNYDYGNEIYDYHNTLIFIRILQSIGTHKAKKEDVIKKLRSIGYNDAALRDAINFLLDKALIESVQGNREIFAEVLSVSVKGMIYLKELIYEYTYLLFVCDDVPMPDNYKEDIEEKFGDEDIPIFRGSLDTKNESVAKFIEFISEEEKCEELYCPSSSKGTLEQIRGESGISEIMRAWVEETIKKMTQKGSSRFYHKPKKISINRRGETR